MNTTDQAFIRAYGSDVIPSNADEAARAADYSALADSNVNAVFGSMPQKHTRVDGPAGMPPSVTPEVAGGGPTPPPPVRPRPYLPQPAAPPISPAATQQQALPAEPRGQHPIGQQPEYSDQSEPTIAQSESAVEEVIDDQSPPHDVQPEALPSALAPIDSHAHVPRPHINFATVKAAQAKAQAKAQATEVVTNLAPLTEHPQAPPQVIANEALRPEDGLSVLADSSVLIGSSDFQWPTVNEPAPVLESEDLESNIETEPQVEPTSLVEDTSEVETHVVPPVVIPEIESEEPAKSTESPALSSSITNVDKDATGLEMDAKSAETVVVKPRIKPAWEVDRLLWPRDVDQLYESESEYFSHAGEKLLKASQEGLRVLGVSSTNEGEGCTTLTICLARAAAEAGAKVGLLDANLRSPQLGAALGLDFARSWHETLNGRIPLAEAAVTAIADNVTLMPLSKNAMHQGLTLDGDLINDILGQAAETFDLVLVDIGVLSEAGRSSFQAGTGCPLDAAIIVRDVRVTSEEETLETVNQFKELGIDAVGIAENFAPSAAVQAAA